MDKIIIKEAKFDCNVGVTDKERGRKQRIIVDVELFADLRKASHTDNIKNTINYSEVYKSIRNVAEKKDYRLIETLAENVAKEILNNSPAKKVVVRVEKPMALAKKNVKYAAVEIIRKKFNTKGVKFFYSQNG